MARRNHLMILGLAISFSGLSVACQREAPDTRAADEQAIRAAEDEGVKACDEKDLERFLSFYTEDASLFPPNASVATGKAAMRALLLPLFTNPGFKEVDRLTKVEVARSGELAYAIGTYETTIHDSKGKPLTERGHYVDIWKKQPDGTWKHTATIWNSDQPPPSTPTTTSKR